MSRFYVYDDGDDGMGGGAGSGGSSQFGKQSLEEMFQQARARDEELLRKRREQINQEQSKYAGYKWLKYFMYFWMGRLAIVLVGSLIPYFFAVINGSRSPVTYNPKLEEINWKLLSDLNFQNLKDPKSRTTPFIIKEAPIISNSALKLFLSSLFQTYKLPIKTSSSNFFSYYSDDRLWSKELQNTQVKTYQYISIEEYFNDSLYRFPPFPLLDFMKKSFKKTAAETNESVPPPVDKFMYLGYPHIASYLEKFAPSLAKIMSSLEVEDPQCNLWMANEGVVAQMHYDYQDNFLLQISGTKTVLLASPEFMDFLAPYPSLHPLWRQASVSQNISYDSLYEHLQDLLDLEREQGSQGNAKRSVLHKSQAQVEAANAQPMAWNVTLQAGDILFIPSGYLHQVIVGENSISLNAWIPSVFSLFHYRLVNKVALPFLLDDSIDLKLAKLAIIMREVCLFLGDKDNCLVERLAHRYEKVFQSDDLGVAPLEDQRCLLHDITSLCNPLTSLRLADAFHLNRRVAKDIMELFTGVEEAKRVIIPVDLKFVLLMDYIEEALLLIFPSVDTSEGSEEKEQQHSLSICTMQTILSYCWDYSYL